MDKPRRVAYKTFDNMLEESYGYAHMITNDCDVIIETKEGKLIRVHMMHVRFINPLSDN